MNQADLIRNSENLLKNGSKSFAFATLFFSKEVGEDVAHLYAWCRTCDDVTDGSTLGFDQNPTGLSHDRVEVLRKWSKLAVQGKNLELDLPFLAFGKIMQKYRIPWIYADDLLIGMGQDAAGETFEDLESLLQYCYRVAGTVGLMMCHLMGLKNSNALKNAVDLGIALQLTNIARDIGDDFRVSKLYLPTRWLLEFKIPPDDILNPDYSSQLESLVKKLLGRADTRYQSGLKGLIDLPWRCALAVSIAASVYRTIGKQVLQLGHRSWKTRVCLGKRDKTKAVFIGICRFLATVPSRVLKPRRTVSIDQVWRYS